MWGHLWEVGGGWFLGVSCSTGHRRGWGRQSPMGPNPLPFCPQETMPLEMMSPQYPPVALAVALCFGWSWSVALVGWGWASSMGW